MFQETPFLQIDLQWKEKFKDTKGVIRNRKWKDRQYNDQKLEDTKGVIRIRKWKDRQYNDQKKKYKQPNNDVHVMEARGWRRKI